MVFGRNVAGGAPAFGTIDLSSLAPSDGFVIQGDEPGDGAGWAVSAAGDVNGDGIGDLIVGTGSTSFYDPGANNAYVIFGRDVIGGAAAFGTIDLSSLASTDGFTIQGDRWSDGTGRSVSAAGDINGDGIDDLIVGVPFGDDGGTNAGEAYVVYGRDVAGGAAAFDTIDLSTFGPTDGFIIQGDEAVDYAGYSVSAAGDVNGDGIGDMIIGAPYNDDGGDNVGAAYVVFGRDVAGGAAAFSTIDLSSLAPTDGFIIQGRKSGDETGRSVSAAGDVNGDGIDDLIISAPNGLRHSSHVGNSYVLFGRDVGDGDPAFGNINLTSLAQSDWFVMLVDSSSDYSTSLVSSAGDINGDGIDDLIIGEPNGNNGEDDVGKAYVVLGRDVADGAAAFPRAIDFTWTPSTYWFHLHGGAEGDKVGWAVSAAGDVNGDGVDDLIIGAPGVDDGGSGAGGAYVFFGSSELKADPMILWGDRRDNTLTGASGDDKLFGYGGNDKLDGYKGDDVLRGHAGDDALWGRAGNDRLFGQAGDDALHGGDDNDFLNGGDGNDRLWGEAGQDVFRGGKGADALRGGDGNDLLSGGSGNDRLWGEAGQDVLLGGKGADRFIFSAATDSFSGAADMIADFGKRDQIILKGIDADSLTEGNQALEFIKKAAFSGVAGELRWEKLNKTKALVQVDIDGDANADMEIKVILDGVKALHGNDFLLS